MELTMTESRFLDPEDEAFNEIERRSKVKQTLVKAQLDKPKREWVGLTDEEIWTVLQFRGYNTETIEIAKAIEAKLKEKNT
jgi:hypothetical protein